MITFLTIVSIFCGFLIFLLILVVHEAKKCKKEKRRAAERKRASISARRRSSIDPKDFKDMYEVIDQDYIATDKGQSGDSDDSTIGVDTTDRTLTPPHHHMFYETPPDTAKNAETLLRHLFDREPKSRPSMFDFDFDDKPKKEEAVYENVPKPGESLRGWFGSKVMRRNTTFNHTTRRPSSDSDHRKISFSSFTSPEVILNSSGPRRSSNMRPSISSTTMGLQPDISGSIKYSSQRRRRPALVFSNQLSYCDDTYTTIV